MKKKLFLFLLCVFLIIVCVVSGTAAIMFSRSGNNSTEETTAAATTAPNTLPSTANYFTMRVGGAKFIQLPDNVSEKTVQWKSSNDSIATVDSAGRVDAARIGTAVITAVTSNGKNHKYTVNVLKSKKTNKKSYSTCILANLDVLAKNKKAALNNVGESKNLYAIKVNRLANCVTVYTYGSDGKYNVPVRAMICSTGLNNSTVTGTFYIGLKTEWLALEGDVFGRYISGFSGDFLFHSVPYYTLNQADLEVEEFNKLGVQASQGCVRLSVEDARWIYKNCAVGTEVTVYDDEAAGPLGRPDSIIITDYTNKWDPTDSAKESPYANAMPKISGASSCIIKKGGEFFALTGVTAVDSFGNDISDKIKMFGKVITTKSGKYKITYSVTDALKRTASTTITVTVR